jgi:hypothetical protein
MKDGAEQINKAVADAFRAAKSPAGEKWPKLKFGTIKASARKVKGKGKKKRFERSSILFGVGKSILVQSGLLQNSAKSARARGKRTIEWSALKYGAPHMTGFSGTQDVPTRFQKSKKGKLFAVQGHTRNMNLPKRNFSVFEVTGNRVKLIPKMRLQLTDTIRRYIATGKV